MKIYINLTNFMKVSFLSGIQRVVMETLTRLIKTENEIILFAFNTEQDSLFLIDNYKLLLYFEDEQKSKNDAITSAVFDLDCIEPHSIYYEIDASWNNTLRNNYIYRYLKERGTRIVCYIYDVVPIKFPQFSHEATVYNFILHFTAVLRYADEIHVSAEVTKRDIIDILNKTEISRDISIKIIPLASDFKKKITAEKIDKSILKKIDNMGEFLLLVGTIEPRKNHKIVIDMIETEKFKEVDKKIVIVGRIGWKSEELMNRITSHREYGKKLFFFDKINDVTLEEIYTKAYALVFPSFYEGFGLPIVEALSKGIPVFSSDVEVLREVGKEYANYFDPNDSKTLISLIRKYEIYPEKYERMKKAIKSFVVRTWDETVLMMIEALRIVDNKKNYGEIKIKQMVFLSSRSETILDTLLYVEKLMKFIKEIVIVCPENNVNEIKRRYEGGLEIDFLTDEYLVNAKKLPKDHSTRNFYLRALLSKEDKIDPYFIASDDDARPLVPITQDVFVENNRLNAHYFYSLSEWRPSIIEPSSFDLASQKTHIKLNELNCPTMYYCSHMPQAMSKDVWKELLKNIPDIENAGLAEWTMFYNFGIKHHPYLFNRVKFKTLCWPGIPSDWEYYVYPDEFIFENYYETYYNKGGIFEGFSKKYVKSHVVDSMKKIAIRSALQRAYENSLQTIRAFEVEYQNKFGVMPSFVARIRDDEILVNVPKYYTIKSSEISKNINTKIVFSLIKEQTKTKTDVKISCSLIDTIRKGNKEIFRGAFTSSSREAEKIEIYFKNPELKGEYLLSLNININGKNHKKDIPVFAI